MLKTRRMLLRLSMAAAPVIAALALGAPGVTRAAATIVIDDVTPADNCGTYDGDTAQTDPVTAINTAANGSTVVICPGTYDLVGQVEIENLTKLTVKRALTGPGDTPTLVTDKVYSDGIYLNGSTGITFDGLVIDGRDNLVNYYNGFYLLSSGVTIKNSAILGPDRTGSTGVFVNNSLQTKALALTITNTAISGYQGHGVYLYGPAKLAMTGSHLDGSDGGRVVSTGSVGVTFFGATSDVLGPTGSVSGSRLLNNSVGVEIDEAAKVTVSDNLFLENEIGVYIEEAGAYRDADDNTITGNTIEGVPEGGIGVSIADVDAATWTVDHTTITGNVIVAGQYAAGSPLPYGVLVFANATATATVTGDISGNTLYGFALTPTSKAVVNTNDYAGVDISNNTFLP